MFVGAAKHFNLIAMLTDKQVVTKRWYFPVLLPFFYPVVYLGAFAQYFNNNRRMFYFISLQVQIIRMAGKYHVRKKINLLVLWGEETIISLNCVWVEDLTIESNKYF